MTERPNSDVDGIIGVHHLGLTVTDLGRSTAWYEQILGLVVVRRVDVAGVSFVTLRARSAELFLTLYRHPANDGERFEETRTGLDHLSFGVASRAALRRWSDHLSDQGVEHSPVAEDPFGGVLVFRDPDNIQLELVAPAPDPGEHG